MRSKKVKNGDLTFNLPYLLLRQLEIDKEQDEEEPPFFDYEDMEPYKTHFEADDYVLLV